MKALGIYDMIFHPSASCICLFICSITVQVMYCIQLLLPLLLARSLHTPPISRPICLGLLYSLICPSVHSSLSIPPSINLASRLLSCTPPLRPSVPPPPSVYQDFVKAREDERYRLNTAPVISHFSAHSSAHWAVILHRSMNGDLHSDLQ